MAQIMKAQVKFAGGLHIQIAGPVANRAYGLSATVPIPMSAFQSLVANTSPTALSLTGSGGHYYPAEIVADETDVIAVKTATGSAPFYGTAVKAIAAYVKANGTGVGIDALKAAPVQPVKAAPKTVSAQARIKNGHMHLQVPTGNGNYRSFDIELAYLPSKMLDYATHSQKSLAGTDTLYVPVILVVDDDVVDINLVGGAHLVAMSSAGELLTLACELTGVKAAAPSGPAPALVIADVESEPDDDSDDDSDDEDGTIDEPDDDEPETSDDEDSDDTMDDDLNNGPVVVAEPAPAPTIGVDAQVYVRNDGKLHLQVKGGKGKGNRSYGYAASFNVPAEVGDWIRTQPRNRKSYAPDGKGVYMACEVTARADNYVWIRAYGPAFNTDTGLWVEVQDAVLATYLTPPTFAQQNWNKVIDLGGPLPE